jgi:hypothetical protein
VFTPGVNEGSNIPLGFKFTPWGQVHPKWQTHIVIAIFIAGLILGGFQKPLIPKRSGFESRQGMTIMKVLCSSAAAQYFY